MAFFVHRLDPESMQYSKFEYPIPRNVEVDLLLKNCFILQQSNSFPFTRSDLQAATYGKACPHSVEGLGGNLGLFFCLFVWLFSVRKVFFSLFRPGLNWMPELEQSFSWGSMETENSQVATGKTSSSFFMVQGMAGCHPYDVSSMRQAAWRHEKHRVVSVKIILPHGGQACSVIETKPDQFLGTVCFMGMSSTGMCQTTKIESGSQAYSDMETLYPSLISV